MYLDSSANNIWTLIAVHIQYVYLESSANNICTLAAVHTIPPRLVHARFQCVCILVTGLAGCQQEIQAGSLVSRILVYAVLFVRLFFVVDAFLHVFKFVSLDGSSRS